MPKQEISQILTGAVRNGSMQAEVITIPPLPHRAGWRSSITSGCFPTHISMPGGQMLHAEIHAPRQQTPTLVGFGFSREALHLERKTPLSTGIILVPIDRLNGRDPDSEAIKTVSLQMGPISPQGEQIRVFVPRSEDIAGLLTRSGLTGIVAASINSDPGQLHHWGEFIRDPSCPLAPDVKKAAQMEIMIHYIQWYGKPKP